MQCNSRKIKTTITKHGNTAKDRYGVVYMYDRKGLKDVTVRDKSDIGNARGKGKQRLIRRKSLQKRKKKKK